MVPYLLAAAALSLALVCFGLAMRHRTILDADVETELVARLDRLTPASTARWGRMTVAQMLRHCSSALSMATGSKPIPVRVSPLAWFPLKNLVINVFPFPKGAPTAPALVVRDECEFETEVAAVRAQLSGLSRREGGFTVAHPLFGSLSREQWGVLIWKHLDHHLRQFGV